MKRIPASYERVWAVVARIPRGKVSTYGAVARTAGLGEHARLVGYALHALPDGAAIPWHRVINARGEISLRKSPGAAKRQERLLNEEGVLLREGRIDLSRFGWRVSRRKS